MHTWIIRGAALAVLVGALPIGGCLDVAANNGRGPVADSWRTRLGDHVRDVELEFGVPTIGVDEVASLPEDTLILDVRSQAEVAVSTLPGVVVLCSDSSRETFARSNHDRPVLVYCTVGWRSAEYVRELTQAGVTAWNLEGGICAWAGAGHDIVDANGSETQRIHAFSESYAACVPPAYEAVY